MNGLRIAGFVWARMRKRGIEGGVSGEERGVITGEEREEGEPACIYEPKLKYSNSCIHRASNSHCVEFHCARFLKRRS